MKRSDADSCTRLPWDSEFFGMEIAKVQTEHLTPEALADIGTWCADHAIDCLYFLADPNDAVSLRCAERFGFELVDVRTTLTRRIGPEGATVRVPEGAAIRPALPSDLAALGAIARSSYHDSRFYFDGRFPVEKCDRLYEIWLEKSYSDETGVVLVAEWQGTPSGYVTCDRVDEATGQIGLIASAVPGVGLGTALASAAVNWFRDQGFTRAQVVTQGRNVRAQALYQVSGFVTSAVELWYHRWFHGSSEG